MRQGFVQILGFLLLAAPSLCWAEGVRVRHLYELSDFTGPIPYSDVVLHVDREHDEVYGVVGNTVRIFNGAGMEVYRFEFDVGLGRIFGLAVEQSGDIVLLTYVLKPGVPGEWSLVRCDYRGEPIGSMEVEGLPRDFASFKPNRMVYRDGSLYLISTGELRAVVLDGSGSYQRGYDFARLLEINDPGNHEIRGFDVAPSGELLFTIPVLFKAFVVSPDGETVRQFGSPGSIAGKFGIVSGIVADDRGHYLVADKLRRVVMVFDAASLEVITEIGGNGSRYVLSRPTDLAVGNSDRIYITQSQQKGVAVFSVAAQSVRVASNNESAGTQQKGGRKGSTDPNPTTAEESGTALSANSRTAVPPASQ